MDTFSDHRADDSSRRADAEGDCIGEGTAPVACVRAAEELRIVSDLPKHFPVDRDELGILRAFLSEEIRAIMKDEDDRQEGP